MADVLTESEDQEIWASHLNRHMDAFGRDHMLTMVGNMRARLERAEAALREAELLSRADGRACPICMMDPDEPDEEHTADCPFAALGVAGEEQADG